MVTNAGGGSSRWKDFAITRWREDATCDNWGTFCYLRDVASGQFWSVAYQPTLRADRALRGHLHRRPRGVSPARSRYRDAYRDRRFAGGRHRAAPRAHYQPRPHAPHDRNHQLCRNGAGAGRSRRAALGVQQSVRADRDHRAPCRNSVHTPAALARRAHADLVSIDDGARRRRGRASFETDRVRFIGRGGTLAAPHAMLESRRAVGLAGSVLDPIAAIRQQITHRRGRIGDRRYRRAELRDTRDAVLGLIEKYQDRRLADRVFDLTWTHSQVVLRQLNATEADAQLYGRLASSVSVCATRRCAAHRAC